MLKTVIIKLQGVTPPLMYWADIEKFITLHPAF